jgi:hypothetical protein
MTYLLVVNRRPLDVPIRLPNGPDPHAERQANRSQCRGSPRRRPLFSARAARRICAYVQIRQSAGDFVVAHEGFSGALLKPAEMGTSKATGQVHHTPTRASHLTVTDGKQEFLAVNW